MRHEQNPGVARVVEVIAAGAVVLAASVVALAQPPSRADWIAAAFFACFGVLASSLGYRTSRTTLGNIGFLPYLSIAAISPNAAAIASIFVSVAATELIARRAPIKAIFNVSQYSLAQSIGILAFTALGGESIRGRQVGVQSIAAFVAMITCFLAVNKLAVSTVVSVSEGKDTREHWLSSMRLSAVYDVFSFPLIYLFAAVYAEFGWLLTATLALPILGVRQFYKQNIALQRMNEELLQLMVATVEAQDPYTSGHSQRVARYARVIARVAGLNGRDAERVAIAALLHDVGKIYGEFAPILRKPGRLTDAEYDVMKTHPARGAALVERVSNFKDVVPAILAHHEAWDGRGYPNGLFGDRIPLAARIIAIADTIDAMSTSRPYRDAMSEEAVRSEIDRERGRQFDPSLCAALLRPESWSELVSELAIATSEYPVRAERMPPGSELSPRSQS